MDRSEINDLFGHGIVEYGYETQVLLENGEIWINFPDSCLPNLFYVTIESGRKWNEPRRILIIFVQADLPYDVFENECAGYSHLMCGQIEHEHADLLS